MPNFIINIRTYDADGKKLRKVNTVSGTTTTTDYVSGIQYNNSTTAVGYISTEEGQAAPNGTGYDYQYFLGDNLGNTRVTFGTKTGSAVQYQKDDCYPFGLEISRAAGSPKNEYLYNKKELQDEAGFGLYDYGARFYDPVVAKWTTMDPLAEISRRWSPYNYVENDPIRLTDPDGMTVGDYIDELLTSVGNQFMKESDNRVADQKIIDNTKINTYTTYESGEKTSETKVSGVHFVLESKTPTIYNDLKTAFSLGKPPVLNYLKDKTLQGYNRDDATGAYPSRNDEGLEKQEYPYASSYQGGLGAYVTYVPAREQRAEGGELSAMYKKLNDGDTFVNIPVPADQERQRVREPRTLTRQVKAVGAVGVILTILTWLSKVPIF